MEPQPPITPEEIRGTMFAIADIGEHVATIRYLLEDDDGEETEDNA